MKAQKYCLKTLVIALGFTSVCVFADTAPSVIGTDPVWANVIARNQDNANGVDPLYVGQTDVTGLAIGDFVYNDNQDGYWQEQKVTEPSAQFSLYDAELYVDSQLSPYIRAHIALAYGTTGTSNGNPARAGTDGVAIPPTNPTTTNSFFFPEAYVTFFDNTHWFAKVGQEYLNFGSIDYQSITTPLPQVFTLIDATALTAGFVNYFGGLYFDATVYNGNPYGVTTSSTFASSSVQAHGYVFDLGYTQEYAGEGYNVFVDYANNISDSASIVNEFAGATTPMLQQTPAITAHGDYYIGAIALSVNYFSALQAFNPSNWSFNGAGAKPSAYDLQGTYSLAVGQHASSFVIGYEGSQDALNFVPMGASFPMPQTRFLVGYNFNLTKNVLLQLEYDNDKDYSTGDTGLTFNGIDFGSSSTDNSVLARLNVSF